jgi:hypothetical protein
MKKSKKSGFAATQKRLTKESKSARVAIRELYTDDAFIRDFDEIGKVMCDAFLGKKTIRESIRVRLFPSDNMGIAVENLEERERVAFYQEAGAELGRKGKQVVAVFRAKEKGISSDPEDFSEGRTALVLSASTVDFRVMGSIWEVQRDSNGVIQNLVSKGHAHKKGESDEIRVMEDGNIAPDVTAFVVGYGYGMQDHVVGNLLKK